MLPAGRGTAGHRRADSSRTVRPERQQHQTRAGSSQGPEDPRSESKPRAWPEKQGRLDSTRDDTGPGIQKETWDEETPSCTQGITVTYEGLLCAKHVLSPKRHHRCRCRPCAPVLNPPLAGCGLLDKSLHSLWLSCPLPPTKYSNGSPPGHHEDEAGASSLDTEHDSRLNHEKCELLLQLLTTAQEERTPWNVGIYLRSCTSKQQRQVWNLGLCRPPSSCLLLDTTSTFRLSEQN